MYYTYYTVKNFACGALYNTYNTNVTYHTTEPLRGSVLYRADSDQYPALLPVVSFSSQLYKTEGIVHGFRVFKSDRGYTHVRSLELK